MGSAIVKLLTMRGAVADFKDGVEGRSCSFSERSGVVVGGEVGSKGRVSDLSFFSFRGAG